jgi:hypothetical protein
MTTLKIISIIFICAFLINSTCPSKTEKINPVNKTNPDTTYGTSTEKLKSNKIPDSVFKMVTLRHLSISGMDCDYGDKITCWEISEIPPQIKNLQNLITLSLTVNNISAIPIELTELKKLTLIDLTDNLGIDNIDILTKMQSLQHLSLYGCRLRKLPDNIGNLKNLKYLGLTGNNINKAEQERIKNALPNCMIKF